MQTEELKAAVMAALEDMKAQNISCVDVRGLSSLTDLMLIASGTSKRHVASIADNVAQEVKKQGVRPLGTEGTDESEWVLVDLGDIVVHVMLPDTREFYALEKLWQGGHTDSDVQSS